MRPARTYVFPLVAALVVILALAAGALLSGAGQRAARQVVLPPEQPGRTSISPGVAVSSTGWPASAEPLIRVDAQAVQKLLTTLERPAQYRAEYRIERFWEGGSQVMFTTQYVRGGLCKTELADENGKVFRSILTDGEVFCQWEGESALYFPGVSGEQSSDDLGSLPTYEDVLALPAESITNAQYETLDGHPCLLVETEDELYASQYRVTLDTCMLYGARLTESAAPAYVCELVLFDPAAPGDEAFWLPDGVRFVDWLADRQN